MTTTQRRFALFPVCLIWLGVIASALGAAWLKGLSLQTLFGPALIATTPALLGLILTPVIHKEWAQILVILGWLALAVVAVLGVSFVPMAILFMCAPAAAALFERDKVVEAMIMAAILAALLFYAGQQGVIPESLVSAESKEWGQQMGIFATLAFLIGSLMTIAQGRSASGEASVTAPVIDHHNNVDANFDMFPGDFFIIDDKNHIKSVNQSARQTFELRDDKGADFASMLGLDEATSKSVNDLIDRARKVNEERSGSFLIRSDEDNLNYQRVAARPLGKGDVALSMHNMNDNYHEIVRLQRERGKAQKEIDEKSLFFAGVSHELRTPLNAIIGFSDMMRSRLFGPLPSKYAEYADMIHDSGQHMLDLIGDVLDLSKVDAGKYELKYDTFQAEDIIRSSLKMVRPTADAAEVILQSDILAESDLIIEADRRAVRQILLNLLSNAIKFSPKGSTITTRADRMGRNLRLSVIDNGAGMSPEMVEKIGQPYLQDSSETTTDIRGTGLGLSLVKSLAELHGGVMGVESQLGEGTSIHIDLPFERDQ